MLFEWSTVALFILLVAIVVFAPVVYWLLCERKKTPPAPIITTENIKLREL